MQNSGMPGGGGPERHWGGEVAEGSAYFIL
jgi:hypothetical protein